MKIRSMLFAVLALTSLAALGEDGPLFIDGGESKAIYTPADSIASYGNRKNIIGVAGVNDCVTPPLRQQWPAKVSVSYWVSSDNIDEADPDKLQRTVNLTLRSADDLAWFYPEKRSYLIPEDVPNKLAALPSQIEAVRAAKQNVKQKLILAGHFGGPDGTDPMPRPQWIADHAAYLDGLPFDGLFIYLKGTEYYGDSITHEGLGTTPVSELVVDRLLQPLRDLHFKALRTNLAVLHCFHFPAMTDAAGWAIVCRNATTIARSCRRAGLAGFAFDNEHYGAPCWAYPANSSPRDMAEYDLLAMHRGKQFAQALWAGFPKAIVLVMLPPSWAFSPTPEDLYATEGPFSAGMVQALSEIKGPK